MAVGPTETFPRLLSTLESVSSQVGAGVEIIIKVVGNRLAEEIDAYREAHPGLSIGLRVGSDQGPYDAFNICAVAATGEYILFLGCGDRLADTSVAADLERSARMLGTPEVIYGHVLLTNEGAGRLETFSTDCFFGHRARFPWRNPCHSQGLVYRRDWLTRHPFRADIGPLADLFHTYRYRVFERANWVERPIAIFRTDGASYARDWASLSARLRGVRANCENFRFAAAWKLLASLVYYATFVIQRFRRPGGGA